MKKKYLIVVLILIVLNSFYRISFIKEFDIEELIQFILYVVYDILISICIVKILNLLKSKIKIVLFLTFLNLVIFALSSYLTFLIHFKFKEITIGLSEYYLKIHDKTSFRVFDTWLVLAFNSIILIIYETLIKLHNEQEKVVTISYEKKNLEINLLKSFIIPHFLFNTLNTIYFLTNKNSLKAQKAILFLSDILRFQIEYSSYEKIIISKEIENIKNYIELLIFRKGENFNINFNHEVENDIQISSFLYLNLVENAFKFSGNSINDFIFISLTQDKIKNELKINIENSIKKNQSNIENTKQGILNLKKRLQIEYENKHELQLTENDKTFIAELIIKYQ